MDKWSILEEDGADVVAADVVAADVTVPANIGGGSNGG